jgi:transcriptional regulator with XRE-family HTH domain
MEMTGSTTTIEDVFSDVHYQTARPTNSSFDEKTNNGWKVPLVFAVAATILTGGSGTRMNPSVDSFFWQGVNSNLWDHREISVGQIQQPLLVVEQARLVANGLGLSKSELANVFGVSRPALYAWINGESVPQGENAQRLGLLAELLRDTLKGAKRPLFHEYVTEPLQGKETSLHGLIMKKHWNKAELTATLSAAWQQTLQRDERMTKLLKPTAENAPTPEKQEHNLLENMSVFPPEP